MSVMKRVRDLTAARTNDQTARNEDPVKFIDGCLMEQREQIAQTERLQQQFAAHARGLRQELAVAEQLRQKREQQAGIALKLGEEQIARLAWQEKLELTEKSERFAELLEQSSQSVAVLEEQLRKLRAEYAETLDKRRYAAARYESIRLQHSLNERLAVAGKVEGRVVFDKVNDRLARMEYEFHALRELRTSPTELQAGVNGFIEPLTLDRELMELQQRIAQERIE